MVCSLAALALVLALASPAYGKGSARAPAKEKAPAKSKPLTANPTQAAFSVKFIPDPAYAAEAQRLLEGAGKSVLVLQFNFEIGKGITQTLADLIVAKKALGPTVLLEAKGFGADKKNPATRDYLKGKGVAGVALVTGKPNANGNHADDGILHSKVLVVDGAQILAGSTNWTNTSIGKNNETNLSITSPKLASALIAYARQIQASGGASLVSGSTQDGDVTLFTDLAYQQAILDFLGRPQAGDKLDCSMYFFNTADPTDNTSSGIQNTDKPSDRILAAVVAAQKRGAAVRILFDGAAFDRKSPIGQGNDRSSAQLKQQGVTSLFLAEPGKITHQKFCALRPKSGKPSAILGSTNWNPLDIDLNHQVNWRVDNDAGGAASALGAYFDKEPKTPY